MALWVPGAARALDADGGAVKVVVGRRFCTTTRLIRTRIHHRWMLCLASSTSMPCSNSSVRPRTVSQFTGVSRRGSCTSVAYANSTTNYHLSQAAISTKDAVSTWKTTTTGHHRPRVSGVTHLAGRAPHPHSGRRLALLAGRPTRVGCSRLRRGKTGRHRIWQRVKILRHPPVSVPALDDASY